MHKARTLGKGKWKGFKDGNGERKMGRGEWQGLNQCGWGGNK